MTSIMKSYYFCLLFCLIVSMVWSAPDQQKRMDPKLRERLTATITECQKTTHASEADLAAIREKRMPTSHEGQCLMECVFSATKIMNNGQFDKNSAVKVLVPQMKGDAEKVGKLAEMLETCDKEIGTNSDKCTTAKKIVECTQKHGKAFGFQMPVHI